MMVVHPNEVNTFDQRWIEYTLWDKFRIQLIRKSLSDIANNGTLHGTNAELMIDGKIIAISYFRAGYGPEDYPSLNEWNARLLIERSFSIKCPSVAYQLVGTKKIQQVLAQPTILEKFLNHEESIKKLRGCFTGLYSLTDGENGVKEIIQRAIENPQNYVMKPQREGGGNNYFGDKLKESLQKMSPSERGCWILMERIIPPTIHTYMLREGKIIETLAVGELGIFSVFVNDGDQEIVNKSAGYLLRTKSTSFDDGGVAAGVAVLDSPYLV